MVESLNNIAAEPLRIRDGRPDAVREFITTEELAERLRTTSETVRYWRHIGKGPRSFKVGRRVLYAREDVETFIAEARKVPVGGPPDRAA